MLELFFILVKLKGYFLKKYIYEVESRINETV